jgi:hypothetical protein
VRLRILTALIASGIAFSWCPSGIASAAETTKQPPQAEPDAVSGEIHPASVSGESGRRLLDALLFVPRTVVEVAFIASTETASFVEDEQIVPRVRSLLGSDDGKLRITPTFAVASGLRPELGARLTAREGDFASMLRASVVSQDTFQTEGRLLRSFGASAHTQLILEGYQERNADASFGGVGPDPARDPRNKFLAGQEGKSAVFLERRERAIAGVASRVGKDVEVLLSSSFQIRQAGDPRDPDGRTIAQTFAAGSVAGAYDRSERFYTEAAVRSDTRAFRGPPARGVLLEGYLGTSEDARGEFAPAVHTGGRASWFAPIVRKTTIVNPGVTLDMVEPLGFKALPFREYAYAAAFRGSDSRVDRVAALAFTDYRWQLVDHVAARLFVDVTTVAPRLAALRVDHLAWAVGAGLDLHSDTAAIGRVAFAYSSGGVQLFLSYGLADRGFGDRQHR